MFILSLLFGFGDTTPAAPVDPASATTIPAATAPATETVDVQFGDETITLRNDMHYGVDSDGYPYLVM